MRIDLEPSIPIRQLSKAIHKTPEEIESSLRSMGKSVSAGDGMKVDQAIWIAEQEGFKVRVLIQGRKDILSIEPEKKLQVQARPPVVTVMGHVDHGKTVLLDAIRHTNLAGQEPGAITQHIGAYRIHTPGGDIVFLDTPGHEAFAAMRARGAQVTDIVVLVVAADEGVKPQTVEAIQHAQAARVPILVAVNKIDKPQANPLRVREELAKHGLIPEEWQGETITVDISAKHHKNLDHLLEMILLLSEIMELKADPKRPARGTVLESQIDPQLGPTATVLVQDGTLRIRDFFLCGQTSGRVRLMMNEWGMRVDTAGPSTPVQVSYFSQVPKAGDPFLVISGEKEARKLADLLSRQEQEAEKQRPRPATIQEMQQEIRKETIPALPIVLKVDVFGSLQPIIQSLQNLAIPGARITIAYSGVGAISESDVLLASAGHGPIIGFNVKPDSKAELLAQQERVDIRLFSVIYDLIGEVGRLAQGVVVPRYREQIIGRGEVIKVFHIARVGVVAGCLVQEGKFVKGSQARIIRRGIILHTGDIISLKHYDQFVDEIGQGETCGMILSRGFTRYQVRDQVEVFTRQEIPGEIASELSIE
ncbi:MAG: translation initiation factor IF-2 [bacterium]